MQPISLENRRAILQKKLAGASNREVADEFDVSIGTVSNVVAEARDGEFEATGNLEVQLQALLDLGKRLDEAELDVATAQLGLDVYAWLTELGLGPATVERFKADIEALAGDDGDLRRYGTAMRELLELEETTGLSIDDRLGELLTWLAEREPEEVQRLAVIVRQIEALTGDVDQLETAIDQAVELLEFGFDLETAERLAVEIDSVVEGEQQDGIETLVELYDEYEHLRDAVDELSATKESLEADCDRLRERRADLEEETASLQETTTRLERSLDAHEETLEELRATNAGLRDDLAHQRDQLDSIEEELQAKKNELEAIQREREVVHAYRRFLRDADVSDSLLFDLRNLLDIRTGDATDTLQEFEADIQARTISELRGLAMEMLEGEEMMPVAEHERTLREKGRTEQTLEELETERQAVVAFLDFLESGSIPEELLTELLDIKRGRGHWLDATKELKSDKARQYLVERLREFTEGEDVIARSRHTKILEAERKRFEKELSSAFETVDQLADHLLEFQTLLDEGWMREVSRQIVEELAVQQDSLTVEELQDAIEEALEDEVQRRVDLELDQQPILPGKGVVGPRVGLGITRDQENHESG